MKRWVVIIWVLGLCMILVAQLAKPKRAVIFCNVGQGDMVLVIDGGWQMVIDSGSANGMGRRCFDRYVPWWDRVVEVVIVTHDDADHSGGLGSLASGLWVEKLITDGSYKMTGVREGAWLSLWPGDMVRHNQVQLEILDNPKTRQSRSDTGIVSRLGVGETVFWLMADADLEVERMLVWRGQIKRAHTNVLKISHHGSLNGTSEELLSALGPAEAVISVGKNSFGHPGKAVVERLAKRGVRVRRTDMEGDIVYYLSD